MAESFFSHHPHQSMKAPELKEKLHESEKLIQEMTVTWEEKLRKTEEIATVCRKLCLNRHRRGGDHTVSCPCPLTGASETAGEHGHLPGDVRDQSERRQVLPGQPERRPCPERAPRLLPEGSDHLLKTLSGPCFLSFRLQTEEMKSREKNRS